MKKTNMPAVQPFLVRIEFAATSDHGPWRPKYQSRQNDVGSNRCTRNPQTLSFPITEPTGNQIAIDFPIPSGAQFSGNAVVREQCRRYTY